MGGSCMVLFCKNRGPIPGIKYFRLTATRRNSWLRALGRDPNIEHLSETNRVCSLHFADDDIFVLSNRLCLKPGAIPSKQLGIKKSFASLQVVQPEERLRSKDCGSQEIEVLKTGNGKTKNENEKWTEVVYDEWKIKNEELDLKEEPLLENEIKSDNFDNQQLNIILKTESTETKSKNEKWTEVIYDWNIKNEEVDLKEEDLLENGVSESSERYDKDKKYQCHVCGYQAKWESTLKTHVLRHKNPEEVNLFKCDKCEFRALNKTYLKDHELRHKKPEEVDLFRCDECEYQTRYKRALKRHSLLHKNPEESNLFKCDKCEYGTRYKDYLMRHASRHKNPEDFFKCDKCKYRTCRKSDLKIHYLRHKDPEDLFKCDKCEYRTGHKRNLNSHLLKHRNFDEMDLLKCNKCEYETFFKGHFNNHFLKHRNSKTIFRCGKCEYRNSNKYCLTKHILRHKNPEEANLFRCDKCEYRTPVKRNLTRHLLRH